MAKKLSRLEIEQNKNKSAIEKVNKKISELGTHANDLCKSVNRLQALFDQIRNVPTESKMKYTKLKEVREKWTQQAEKIEKDYNNAKEKAGGGAAVAGLGVAVAAFGPTVAMGVATTFGVASTGTAIAALHGAAATNAALAWLGGGVLAAGGGGMAAGSAFLALAGPIGWAIAGVSVLFSGITIVVGHINKKRLENIFTLICKRNIDSYKLAFTELNERIHRIIDESAKLDNAMVKIATFGMDYNVMTADQQFELGAYVNLMESSTMLLVNPIMGLQPKFTEEDFNNFFSAENNFTTKRNQRDMVITLANLLYKIDLDEQDKKIFVKSLKQNKEFLASINKTKKDIEVEDIDLVEQALRFKYSNYSLNDDTKMDIERMLVHFMK